MIHRSCCGFGPLPTVLCYFTSSQCSRFPISVPSIHLPAVYITQVLHTHSSPEHCYNLSGSYTLRPTNLPACQTAGNLLASKLSTPSHTSTHSLVPHQQRHLSSVPGPCQPSSPLLFTSILLYLINLLTSSHLCLCLLPQHKVVFIRASSGVCLEVKVL